MIKTSGTFVRSINANTIVIPLAIIIPIIGATWILSAQLNGISTKGDLAISTTKELKVQVDRIDTNGTQGSTLATRMNTERIGKLEDTTTKLVPDVAEIKTHLGWIADWVKEQKKK